MGADWRSAPLALLLLLTLGCVQLEDRRAEEERALAQAVGQRLDLAFPPRWPELDALEPSPEATALLADGLDQDEAIRVALLENRAVRAAFERLGVASYERVRAGLYANPLLSVSLLFHDPGTEIDLRLSQPLVDLFRRSLRVDLAELELEVARAAVLAQLVDVVCDVRVALLAHQAQQERVELARSAVVGAKEAESLTRELFDAGNVTELEQSLRARARAAAELELLAAEAQAQERREDLIERLGLAVDPGFEVASAALTEVPESPPAEVEARVLERNLLLAQLVARTSAAAARADLSPSASVFDGSRVGVEATKESGESSWGVGPGLSVPIPLFDTGAATQASARAEWRALLAEREQLGRSLASLARRLAARQASLAERASHARTDLVPLASKVMIATLQQYNAMQIGAFDVLRERSHELQQELSALDLWEEAWIARLDLERLLLGATPQHRPMDGASRNRSHSTENDRGGHR